MNIVIDIDGTICNTPEDKNYHECTAKLDNIDKSNKLYDEGHYIIYWTARGSSSKIDWEEITERQLERWGVRYHELRFGKPSYDKWIDDKAINVEDWDENICNS